MSTSGEKLGTLLFELLHDNATDKQMDELKEILCTLKGTHFRSYISLRRNNSFAANVLIACEEALDIHEQGWDKELEGTQYFPK